ncbi:hypothetical protein FKW77_005345 [Venturia effusa]|uniref:Uncharacterized protein n=1 Tax=Venturia effusa TaxID=50376 RepID=A0A517LH74_9PEZI|nr:hypothetical protein FKW77_005345 [Venturia effusa]
MDNSRAKPIKYHRHYHIAAPAIIIGLGILGTALTAAIAIGIHGHSNWNSAKISLVEIDLSQDEPVTRHVLPSTIDMLANFSKSSSLEKLQLDINRAQKGVKLRDGLLMIKDADIAKRDSVIAGLQDALDDEKNRVGRRDEEILRLQGIVKEREDSVQELQEGEVQLRQGTNDAIQYHEARFDELLEAAKQAVQDWEAKHAELEGKFEIAVGQIIALEEVCQAEHGEDTSETVDPASTGKLEGRHDSGYDSEPVVGQTLELIHPRPMVSLNIFRLLSLAEEYSYLDPDGTAIEDETDTTYVKPTRWAPQVSTYLALDGSVDDVFGDANQGTISFPGGTDNTPWIPPHPEFAVHIREKPKISKHGNKGRTLGAAAREHLAQEETVKDVMKTLYRRLDCQYHVTAYPITRGSNESEAAFTPEAAFLHDGLFRLGQQVQRHQPPTLSLTFGHPLPPPDSCVAPGLPQASAPFYPFHLPPTNAPSLFPFQET